MTMATVSASSTGPRKKLANPPVKLACLACRALRTRCDGKVPCSNCVTREKQCSYLPSKRGGPRRKKSTWQSPGSERKAADSLDKKLDEPKFNQLEALSIPGSGLKFLDMPDMATLVSHPMTSSSTENNSSLIGLDAATPPRVRLYGSEQDIVNAYYIFIHKYYAILPPSCYHIRPDKPLHYPVSKSISSHPIPYIPKSPASLAMAAILALIAHPLDPSPSSADSVALRREYAHIFAKGALGQADADTELDESTINPAEALQNEHPIPNRMPLHPHLPVELECLIALIILSLYEYAQRGNLNKMRQRAGQAYSIATSISLHRLGVDVDIYSEARRRAWWMTFYCVTQGSVVGLTAPDINVHEPIFTTSYPTFVSDTNCWPVLLEAQRVITIATRFTADLKHTLEQRGDMRLIYEQMKMLDAWISSVSVQAKSSAGLATPGAYLDDLEGEAAAVGRQIAMIKLCSARMKTHRFRAFLDLPIFAKKHCDFTSITSQYRGMGNGQHAYLLPCACSITESPASANIATSDTIAPETLEHNGGPSIPQYHNQFPFSNDVSTTKCLTAALTTAHLLDSLPYPHPTSTPTPISTSTQTSSPNDLLTHPDGFGFSLPPRMMPWFACCAMQSCYAMLMLYYKFGQFRDGLPGLNIDTEPQYPPVFTTNLNLDPDLESLFGGGDNDSLSDSVDLAFVLQDGLEKVIGWVQNCAQAFEAMEGMRDELEGAFAVAFGSFLGEHSGQGEQ